MKNIAMAVGILILMMACGKPLQKRIITMQSGFAPTFPNSTKPSGSAPEGMVWIPGGEFSMGSQDPTTLPNGGHDAMPDTRPIHRVQVDGFWMDKTEVTNEEFAQFVQATGYVPIAEQ